MMPATRISNNSGTSNKDGVMSRKIVVASVIHAVLALPFTARSSAGPREIGTFFTAAEMKAVMNGAILTRAAVKGGGVFNLPGGGSLILPGTPLIPSWLGSYEVLAEERAFMPCDIAGKGLSRFYNGLFAYSRFKGLTYYSRTDRRFQPYLLESGRISGTGSTEVTGDPVYAGPAPRRVHLFRVRDNRFGDIVFRSVAVNRGNDFIVTNASVEPLSKMGFPVAGAGEYRMMSFYLYNAGDRGFYYYGLHALRVRTGFFITSGLVNAESFANRLRAETVRRAEIMGLDWRSKLRP